MGLRNASMKNRATQIGIEHITKFLHKPTNKGYIAYAHTIRVAKHTIIGTKRHKKPHKPDYPLFVSSHTFGASWGRNSKTYTSYKPQTT